MTRVKSEGNISRVNIRVMRQAKENINRSVQDKENISDELNFYHKWCGNVKFRFLNVCIGALLPDI